MLRKILAIPLVAKLRKSTFVRAVLVSIVATWTDYIVSLSLHHVMKVDEVIATSLGSFCGAIVSFYFNRLWAFKSKDGKLTEQAIKYLLVLGLSVLLNSLGVYLLIQTTNLPFIAERVIVTIVVGLLVNYQLFKRFVFK
ncbi:MAG: GtrA family protein [Saprospiraceae bacterium]|nr:GtrA family protein [Saprospiraceae bacterium]MBK8634337.1 GtrA family protein [Saprospiraceae bacterium]MBP7642319.1 GtrA family protein [Saprospiraceae bacterium]